MNKRLVVMLAIMASFISFGAITWQDHGYIGVNLQPDTESGQIIILDVFDDTPASKADIKPGDVIKAIDDNEFASVQDLVEYVMGKKPGDTVTMLLERNGKEITKRIKLMKRPKDAQLPQSYDKKLKRGEDELAKLMKDMKDDQRKKVDRVLEDCSKATVMVLVNGGGGSGVLIDGGKYMVTAGHVAQKQKTVEFMMTDGRKFKANVLKSTMQPVDLAVCEVINKKGKKLPFMEIANAKEGEHSMMLGFPGMMWKEKKGDEVIIRGGLDMSGQKGMLPIANLGKVAGINKAAVEFRTLVKTPPLPGNSGGPLFNLDGKVIGIVVLSDFNVTGYATPSQWITKYLKDKTPSPEEDEDGSNMSLLKKGA